MWGGGVIRDDFVRGMIKIWCMDVWNYKKVSKNLKCSLFLKFVFYLFGDFLK